MKNTIAIAVIGITILFALAVTTARATTADSTAAGYTVLPAHAGERCTVGGDSLTEQDVALIVRGRRVPLHRLAVQEFLDHQEKYFAKFEPKSALFQEDMSPRSGTALGGITYGWFLFGIYVLVGLVFSGLSAYVAITKGLNSRLHFSIGFILGPIGFLYVVTRPKAALHEIPGGLVKVPSTSTPVPCPACGAMNHPTARLCIECRSTLHPVGESEVERVLRN
jgi:hypothetical protein